MRMTDRSRARLFNRRARLERWPCAERQALTGRHGPIFSPGPPETPRAVPRGALASLHRRQSQRLLALLGSRAAAPRGLLSA